MMKIWKAVEPWSLARATALRQPPATDMWAPNSGTANLGGWEAMEAKSAAAPAPGKTSRRFGRSLATPLPPAGCRRPFAKSQNLFTDK
jgi:hypothetical protein